MDNEVDSELVVNKLAKYTKDVYSQLRSMYCVHGYRPGGMYDGHWVKIAKWCIAFSINPREFMEVMFHARHPHPYVNELTSAHAQKLFFEKRKEYAAEITNAVLMQMAALEKLMSIGREARDILTDPHQEFDSLFKYVVSCNYKLDDLSSLFWEDALELYVTSIYYDSIYGDLITDALKQAARKVRGYANG